MHEIPRELVREIRAAFLSVLDHAVPSYELGRQLGMFDSEEERFIQREVARKLYEPKLPNGGQRERMWVDRLKKLAKQEDWEGSWKASRLAQQFAETEGRYYTRKCMTPKSNKKEFEWVTTLREAAYERKDWDKWWFAKMLLDGPPELVSDFRMEPLFIVERPDGKVDRLIQLVNIRGERSRAIAMDSVAFHASQKFRDFCLGLGTFSWAGGGDVELQQLHLDMNAMMAFKRVKQIVSFGWHPLARRPAKDGLIPGVWFYDDCAIADGQIVLPDKDDIYWIGARGFIVPDHAREGKFLQNRPKMSPQLEIDAAGVKQLFRELCDNLIANIGSLEGCLLVGSMLSYAAAPELYYKNRNFPGLWIHGVKGSGKTTVCRVLVAIQGLQLSMGLDVISQQVTAIGLANALEQYSNICVWADEFRQHQIKEDKLTLLRSGYDRTGAAKYNPLGLQREVNTNFLVSGETTTSDSATSSRFAHVQISATGRTGTLDEQRARLAWFSENKDRFCLLMRHVLLHRAEFVKLVGESVGEWERSAGVQNIEARLREVYGVGFAAWNAFNKMTGAYEADEALGFRSFLMQHARDAAVEVSGLVNVNVFWSDFFSAFSSDAITLKCFKLETVQMVHPPGAPNQGRWFSHTLYIDPDLLIATLKIFMAKQREVVPLTRRDLQHQLSKEPYWKAGTHTRWINGGAKKVWGILVDHHPDGYQPIKDEQALRLAVTGDDLRKGRLFEVVGRLLSAENKTELDKAVDSRVEGTA